MKTRKITSVIAGTILATAMSVATADEPMELTSAQMDNVTAGIGIAGGFGFAQAAGGWYNYAATSTYAVARPWFAQAGSSSVAVSW